jgi:uncharacterized protein (DUF433 family)
MFSRWIGISSREHEDTLKSYVFNVVVEPAERGARYIMAASTVAKPIDRPLIKNVTVVAPEHLVGDLIQSGHLLFGLVWINPERVSGAPCFYGTRVPIKTLFDLRAAGQTLEAFLDDFVGGSREQAQCCSIGRSHRLEDLRNLTVKILFDHNLPLRWREHLPGHEIRTTLEMKGTTSGRPLNCSGVHGLSKLRILRSHKMHLTHRTHGRGTCQERGFCSGLDSGSRWTWLDLTCWMIFLRRDVDRGRWRRMCVR